MRRRCRGTVAKKVGREGKPFCFKVTRAEKYRRAPLLISLLAASEKLFCVPAGSASFLEAFLLFSRFPKMKKKVLVARSRNNARKGRRKGSQKPALERALSPPARLDFRRLESLFSFFHALKSQFRPWGRTPDRDPSDSSPCRHATMQRLVPKLLPYPVCPH